MNKKKKNRIIKIKIQKQENSYGKQTKKKTK